MATRQILQTGTTANDGTGDSLRDAGNKINQNFSSLFSLFGDSVNANVSTTFDSDGRLVFSGASYNTILGIVEPTSSNKYINLPDASGTVVLATNTVTITNKTINSPKMSTLLDSVGVEVLNLNGQPSATHSVEIGSGDSSSGVVLGINGDSADVDICIMPKNAGSIKNFGQVVPQSETLSVSGAAAVRTPVTLVNSVSATNVTLADGRNIGEEKKFISLNTGTISLTPTSFSHHSGNSTIEITTYSACTLIWSGTNWHILSVSDTGITVP
jgi:hypothetical protein